MPTDHPERLLLVPPSLKSKTGAVSEVELATNRQIGKISITEFSCACVSHDRIANPIVPKLGRLPVTAGPDLGVPVEKTLELD